MNDGRNGGKINSDQTLRLTSDFYLRAAGAVLLLPMWKTLVSLLPSPSAPPRPPPPPDSCGTLLLCLEVVAWSSRGGAGGRRGDLIASY